MKYYSTNNKDLRVSLQQAVTEGLAADKGLYLPESIPSLPAAFFETMEQKTFQQLSFEVASNLIGDDVPREELRRIVDHTVAFEAPVVPIEAGIFALELFHGPTLAFKDFGARFMSQLLGYFARQRDREIVILVATSGDTGSAVANGFLGVEGTRVIVLYPAGKVSEIQEKQFTTLGQNITALEVQGTFDDCQRMVKDAFQADSLRSRYFLTSANSINIARLIPQSFYYFHAYAQLRRYGRPVVFSVPSGNFGNITGGLLAMKMGLPIAHFIAATNINDIVPQYLEHGSFEPRPSRTTISNAMDVGDPSNFARLLDLFKGDQKAVKKMISGYSFDDAETRSAMRRVFESTGYVLDPHGAIGYLGLRRYMDSIKEDISGVFLETAHPAKFKEVVDGTLNRDIPIPAGLEKFLTREKRSIPMSAQFTALEDFLLNRF